MRNKKIDILIECLQCLSKQDIKDAFPEDIILIAEKLGLNIKNMNIKQVRKLVWWRISRKC